MEFSDTTITIAAASFEISVPVFLVFLCKVSPGNRIVWLCMLGAVVPAIFFMAWVTFGYFLISKEEYAFSFSAIWVMGLFAYLVLLLSGALSSFFLKKWLKPRWAFVTCMFVGPLLTLGAVGAANIA